METDCNYEQRNEQGNRSMAELDTRAAPAPQPKGQEVDLPVVVNESLEGNPNSEAEQSGLDFAEGGFRSGQRNRITANEAR